VTPPIRVGIGYGIIVPLNCSPWSSEIERFHLVRFNGTVGASDAGAFDADAPTG
jgi:hypothetical protein